MRIFRKLAWFLSIIVCTWAIFPCLCGNSLSGETKIKHNGKGSVELSIVSDLDRKAFEEVLRIKVNNYCESSGDTDMITLQSVQKTDDGYKVALAFRRIDKIKVRGEFKLENFSETGIEVGLEQETSVQELLRKMYQGNVGCTVTAYYDGIRGSITVPRESVYKVLPYTKDGNAMSYEELIAAGRQAGKSDKLLAAKFFDVGNVKEIRVKLPGKVKYYGGDSVTVVDDETIKLVPGQISANITKNTVIIENGVESFLPVTTQENIGAIVAYVVYEQSINPVTKWVIAIVAGIAVVSVCIFVGYCIRRGKRIIREEEKENV